MRRRRKKRVAEYSVPVVLPLAELAAGNAQVEDPVARLIDRVDVLANHNACVWGLTKNQSAVRHARAHNMARGAGNMVPSSGA
jgi:hypothetical protein